MPFGTHLELSSYVNESHATGIFLCQEGSLAVLKWKQLIFFGGRMDDRGSVGNSVCSFAPFIEYSLSAAVFVQNI